MPMPQGSPALTAQGRQRQTAYDRGDVVLDDCESPGMPFAMISPYPIRFVDAGERILLRMEAYDQERAIHLRAPPGAPAPSPLGYSVGRWEGDTLVVETTRIDYHSFGDLGPAQSDESRVLERFTLSPDGLALDYEAIVTDPVTLAEPWTWRGSFIFREGEELLRWNCGAESPASE
jgi:hypothetical protein